MKFIKKFFGTNSQEATAPAKPAPAPNDAEVEAAQRARELQKQGNALMQSGQLNEAVACYRQATVVAPQHAAGYIGLGYALLQMQSLDEAEAALRQAVALQPRNVDARFMLGNIAQQRGDDEEVVNEMLVALEIDPTFEYAYIDLGPALFRLGRFDVAHQVLAEGTKRFPNNAQLHFYRGNLFAEQHTYKEAVDCFQCALGIEPEHATALANLSTSKSKLGAMDGAVSDLRKALALQPDKASWHSNLLLTLQYQGKLSRQELFEEHLAFAERFEAPLRPQWPTHQRTAEHERLRIGYVSGDFRYHSLAFFIEPTLRHHDRTRVEVYCYHAFPGIDDVTLRFQALVDHWRPCAGLTDQALAQQILEDEIDILIDLSGHTGYNRLLAFAHKPAPIQMTWLGYQATTGLHGMDYRITDASMDPPGMSEAYHSEKLLRIDGAASFQPAAESPSVNRLPALSGLPFTFASVNNPAKITPAALDAWSEILRSAPASRLLMAGLRPEPQIQMLREFEARGIHPERLLLQEPIPFSDYLQMHHRIDLILDTFPYNGGTTSLHALWMGVPMVTLGGSLPVERAGTSMLAGFGFSEFATTSWEEYVAKAVHFSKQLALLDSVRQSLRNRMDTTLVEQGLALTRSLETRLYQAWDTHKSAAERDSRSVGT
ncbi:tetratricopeptide repeat protein [Acidovorax sp. A1169]|uniref:O-linked N-acetylglucosamine transferase, SPINDLY family protein n=1 Tax=Acidovorax sp. A1169 TaxID=3059524 RepID=UPI002737A202|nr:tetratricopeptide repeat protein [Acidovorax sp. A1169]MDP4075695.1 tetratricopeptide repeat protein [Acidovorax sp. A1169]